MKTTIADTHNSFADPDEMGVDLDTKKTYFKYNKKPTEADERFFLGGFIRHIFVLPIVKLSLIFLLLSWLWDRSFFITKFMDGYGIWIVASLIFASYLAPFILVPIQKKRIKHGKTPLQHYIIKHIKKTPGWWLTDKFYLKQSKHIIKAKNKALVVDCGPIFLLADWEAHKEHSKHLKTVKLVNRTINGYKSTLLVFNFKKVPTTGNITISYS